MNRFFSHVTQPSTSLWVCIGVVLGCFTSVFFLHKPVFFLILFAIVIACGYFKTFLTLLLGFIFAIFLVGAHYLTFYYYPLPIEQHNQAINADIEVINNYSDSSPFYVKAKILTLDDDKFSEFRAPLALITIPTKELVLKQRLQVTLKIRPYRNVKNINVFDKALFAFTERVFFKGKVVKVEKYLNSPKGTDFRQVYRDYIKNMFSDTQLYWLYYSLLSGDRSTIPYQEKIKLKEFGLSHLLAISGLHIGLVFLFGFYSCKFVLLSVINTLSQTRNYNVIYMISGYFFAGCYVYLSDFIVSATRALIMLGCCLLLYLLGRNPLAWRNLLYALTLVLVCNPFWLLNPGLYFSFTAVAIIFYLIKHTYQFDGGWKNTLFSLITIQFGLFFGLMPLSLLFFSGFSIAGSVVNILAVPLVSAVLMPCLFVMALVHWLFDLYWLIDWFDKCVLVLYQGLDHINTDYRWFSFSAVQWQTTLLLYLFIAWLLTMPYKLLSAIPLLILSLDKLMIEKPSWQLDVFDVGHGLMVSISRNNNALLYDLGPSYFAKYSYIDNVLLPYLSFNRLNVDAVIISHTDNDHSGGLKDFIAAGYNETLNRFKACPKQTTNFHDLHLVTWSFAEATNSNDSSCVAIITFAGFRVMIPGDISQEIEAKLIESQEDIQSTILISAHHGSNSSSSEAFIAQVQPEMVIHSSAYHSPWPFPHPDVVERFQQAGILQVSTAEKGQVRIRFYENHYQVDYARELESYWFVAD